MSTLSLANCRRETVSQFGLWKGSLFPLSLSASPSEESEVGKNLRINNGAIFNTPATMKSTATRTSPPIGRVRGIGAVDVTCGSLPRQTRKAWRPANITPNVIIASLKYSRMESVPLLCGRTPVLDWSRLVWVFLGGFDGESDLPEVLQNESCRISRRTGSEREVRASYEISLSGSQDPEQQKA